MRYRLRADNGACVAVDGGVLIDVTDSGGTTFEVGDGELRPGLINAHDHLHRNHYPRLGSPPYYDAYEWGEDIHARCADTIARARSVDRRDALLFGALKNLLSGVTTVVHHDRWEPDFEDAFPLRVPRLRIVHSLGTEPERAANPGGELDQPLCLHLAEGVTPAIADEVRSADRLGILNHRLIAVHAVGVDDAGVEELARRGVTIAWCPSSNHFLFGRTAPRSLLASVDVVLGSDALLTGVGTLLDELKFARATRLLDDDRLEAAVGMVAAARLRLPAPVLRPGLQADVVLLRRPLLDATCEDVGLVIVGGAPRVGEEQFSDLFDQAGIPTEQVRVGNTVKLVSAPLGSVAGRIVRDWDECRRIFA